MGGLVTEWLWPYNGQPTQFFKTPNGLVSDTRPWPCNRGNTVVKYHAIYDEVRNVLRLMNEVILGMK